MLTIVIFEEEKKYWQWIKKGIPLTIEVGPRDLEKSSVFVGRRDLGVKRDSMDRSEFVEKIVSILEEIQQSLYSRALSFREENTCEINDKEELYSYFTAENKSKPEIHGGFALALGPRPKMGRELKE